MGEPVAQAEVIVLTGPQVCRSLPARLLYSVQGLRLHEEIIKTPEYYPWHAELEILQQHGQEISDGIKLDSSVSLVELGSGLLQKVRRTVERFRL